MNKAESSCGNAPQVQMAPVENQIVVYQPNETVRLDVRLENETVWLNRPVADFAIVELIANCDRFGQWVLNLIADMKEAS